MSCSTIDPSGALVRTRFFPGDLAQVKGSAGGAILYDSDLWSSENVGEVRHGPTLLLIVQVNSWKDDDGQERTRYGAALVITGDGTMGWVFVSDLDLV